MHIQLLSRILALCLLTPASLNAQSTKVDHLTREQILEKAHALESLARTQDGSASAKLSEYPNHYTMVALRHRNGGAEIHEHFADIFIVVEGHATLLTGGSVLAPKTVSPGETKGTSVQGGSPQELKEGDVVHIPAGVPHQLLLPEGGSFVYFVIKVRES